MYFNNSCNERSPLLLAETATVAMFCLLSIWAVRPLLEEWGLFRAYQLHGVGYLANIFPLIAMRPLHLAPSALQWLVASGHPIGVGVIATFLILARYLVARWALSPVLGTSHLWLFATSATLLIGWPGLWLARFHPAQLSAVFFFAAVGFSVRLVARPNFRYFFGSALSVTALLMTYQALALAVAMLPAVAFLSVPWQARGTLKARALRSIIVTVALAFGLFVYIGYGVLIYYTVDGIYESTFLGLLQSQPISEFVWQNLRTSFSTVVFNSEIYVFACASLIGFALLTVENRRPTIGTIAALAVSVTPLLSLIYLSVSHLRDPERALFPATIGFTLILAAVCWSASKRASASMIAPAVLAMLVSATVSAHNVRSLWVVQDNLVQQMLPIAAANRGTPLVLVDYTGKLGDVYTFLETTLSDAVNVRGAQTDIVICTPKAVDRVHPDAARYPIPTTKNCEDMDLSRRRSVTATDAGGEIVLAP